MMVVIKHKTHFIELFYSFVKTVKYPSEYICSAGIASYITQSILSQQVHLLIFVAVGQSAWQFIAAKSRADIYSNSYE